ncbi:hypothetical protein NONO_c17580 [Nocardia nova SH22a]|uniref:Uncharacterized protein n=1 Tax=Nocardia nova SH22a TaxID=1415166 RepID=W5TC59_9NOCA|nr:hypothetical protein [Nocardia nova]AHH16558.1 hypothetical protein NONO_c17580 [Nocardia nova SH22a]
MARYGKTELGRCAVDALALSERVREQAPLDTYRHLVAMMRRDPERMAQLMMTLAIFVDPNSTTGDLQRLIDQALEGRFARAAREAVVGL